MKETKKEKILWRKKKSKKKRTRITIYNSEKVKQGQQLRRRELKPELFRNR